MSADRSAIGTASATICWRCRRPIAEDERQTTVGGEPIHLNDDECLGGAPVIDG